MKHGLQSAEKRTCRGGPGLAHGKGKGKGNGRRPSHGARCPDGKQLSLNPKYCPRRDIPAS